jgi:hypothetical protein
MKPTQRRCALTALAISSVAFGGGSALAGPDAESSASTRYQGKTAQGSSIIVLATKTRVKAENLAFKANCADGRTFGGRYGVDVDFVRHPKVWKLSKGHFNGTISDERAGTQRKFTFAGKIGKKKASGTFHYSFNGRGQDCDTGTVKWSAKRKKYRPGSGR